MREEPPQFVRTMTDEQCFQCLLRDLSVTLYEFKVEEGFHHYLIPPGPTKIGGFFWNNQVRVYIFTQEGAYVGVKRETLAYKEGEEVTTTT